MVRSSVPRSIATHSNEPVAWGENTPASTPGWMVVRINSNSTPGNAGERISRTQPEGSTATSCSSRRSTITEPERSSPRSRAILVPNPVAMRSSTSTVGTLAPRSTSLSMLRLTPVRAARASRESQRRSRSRRMRSPRAAMSMPFEKRPAVPLKSVPPLWKTLSSIEEKRKLGSKCHPKVGPLDRVHSTTLGVRELTAESQAGRKTCEERGDMDFQITEEHVRLQQRCRQLAEDFATRAALHDREATDPVENYALLRQ